MTPTDAYTVIGLLAASIGFLAATLALLAILNWAMSRAWRAGADAAARHIETCMTRALELPLYGPAHGDTALEDEHRQLIISGGESNGLQR